jgi:hypothetical protein
MEQDDYETVMLFRVDKQDASDVYALMPEVPADYAGNLVTCYQHVGQHGSADLHGCIARSRPAKPEEYADLKRELEQLGYRVKVRQRATWRMRENLLRELRGQGKGLAACL